MQEAFYPRSRLFIQKLTSNVYLPQAQT